MKTSLTLLIVHLLPRPYCYVKRGVGKLKEKRMDHVTNVLVPESTLTVCVRIGDSFFDI